MRPVALLTVAFAGCRAKVYSLCEQIFGPDSVDVYRHKDVHSDAEIIGTDADHTYDKVRDVAEEVAKHEYVHLFCDNCAFVWPIVETGRPVILHRHDVTTMRGMEDPAEPYVYKVDNVTHIFTSPGHRDYICGKYTLREGSTHIMYNWPLRSWMESRVAPRVRIPNSIVYFGGVTCLADHRTGYRFYALQWQKLAEAGIDVHVYLGTSLVPEWYWLYRGPGHENIYPHVRIPHRNLYNELAKYDVGFMGYNDLGNPGPKEIHVDYARTCWPNKAFDYMAAGIPTLGYNVGDSAAVVKNWGECVNDLESLVAAYNAAKVKKIDFESYQKDYAMENQTDLLKQLYEITRVKI